MLTTEPTFEDALRGAIRGAFGIEFTAWEEAQFYDGTRHFAVVRKGEKLWHKTYTHEILLDMPPDYLQHEIRTAGEEILAQLISAESFDTYFD